MYIYVSVRIDIIAGVPIKLWSVKILHRVTTSRRKLLMQFDETDSASLGAKLLSRNRGDLFSLIVSCFVIEMMTKYIQIYHHSSPVHSTFLF